MTPDVEVSSARSESQQFWLTVKKLVPEAVCYQMLGNHDARPMKRIKERCPELEPFVRLSDLWSFPGVRTLSDEREELLLGDVVFMHGYRARLGEHVRYNLKNTVCGHTHRGGVFYHCQEDQMLWELNCGYFGDRFALPFGYTAQRRFSHWTLGFGIIDEYGPRFIPL